MKRETKLYAFLKKYFREPFYAALWFIRDARDLFWKLLYFPLPVNRKKVVFVCYNGKNYSCNPKYIAEEMLHQALAYDMVWLLRDMEEYVPEPIRKVPFAGRHALYELATAGVIISNTKNDLRILKKRGQYVIQTWHGSFEAKKEEREIVDKLPPRYVKETIHNSRQTDLFLSNSAMMTQYYHRAFWCESEILECGYPRNDVLFRVDPQIPGKVRSAFGLPSDAKLVIYAPTFRDDGSCDAFDIDCRGILDTLNRTGGSWYLLIRMHPNITVPEGRFPFGPCILDASSYPDVQELMIACDIMITDYSSTVYEFAVLKKPSYIYASDLEAFQQMRGLNDFYFDMPYPICQTNEALLAQLSGYTPESGIAAAEAFLRRFGGVDRGDAAKQVVARIRAL